MQNILITGTKGFIGFGLKNISPTSLVDINGVNANRQMDKYRLQQEEIENHKKRLKKVDINDYLTRKRNKSTFGSV